MSIEQSLAALTAAVEANTAALKGGSGGKTENKTETKPKAETKAYSAKHSKEEMLAVMNEVKEKIDAATAKGIRDEVGKVAKLAELTDAATIDAVYDAAKAALKKAEEDV